MTDTRISLDAAKKSVARIGPEVDPEFTPITAGEKLKHKHRLEREGRSVAFATRREEIRQELRDKRVARPLAVEKSWRQALEEFPPLPVEEEPPDTEDVEATLETIQRHESNGSAIDIQADVAEAYKKLRLTGLSINEFDRDGAYLFWKGYKDNIREFLREYGVKYLGKIAGEGEAEVSERDVKLDDLIEKMEREVPAERKCPKCKAMIPA